MNIYFLVVTNAINLYPEAQENLVGYCLLFFLFLLLFIVIC